MTSFRIGRQGQCPACCQTAGALSPSGDCVGGGGNAGGIDWWLPMLQISLYTVCKVQVLATSVTGS